jgi:replicative DNA helicase
MSLNADRIPPNDREAERAVLGAMLRDNEMIDAVAQIVREEDFYADCNRRVFRGIMELRDKAQPADLVTIADWLHAKGFVADIGGYTYLDDLLDAAPTAANAEYYARIVLDKYLKRTVIHTLSGILRDAYADAQPADQLIGEAEREILAVGESQSQFQFFRVQELTGPLANRLDARFKGLEKSGLPTGLADLDRDLAGLRAGELVIVGARTSVGKTSFALTVAWNATKSGTPVLIVSLEQSRGELMERLAIMVSGIDSHVVRIGAAPPLMQEKLAEALSAINKLPLHVSDTGGQIMPQLAAAVRRYKKQHNIGLVIIDYLQLIEPENRQVNRQEQITAISHGTKALAKELNVPVVGIVQLNREAEGRNDGPRLSDIRESDSLAQDADAVILLWNPDGKSSGEVDIVEAIIAKNRNGRTGSARLAFRKSSMRFENAADSWRPFSGGSST